MLVIFFAQLAGSVIGGALYAILQKGILKWIVRVNPELWPLVKVMSITSGVGYMAGLAIRYGIGGIGHGAGDASAIIPFMYLIGFGVQAFLVSVFVPSTEGGAISVLQAFAGQLLQLAIFVGIVLVAASVWAS